MLACNKSSNQLYNSILFVRILSIATSADTTEFALHRNLLVVLAHFAWVGPAVLLLSKVKMFFGTGARSSTLTRERKIGAANNRVVSDIKGGDQSKYLAERVQSTVIADDFKGTEDTDVTVSRSEDTDVTVSRSEDTDVTVSRSEDTDVTVSSSEDVASLHSAIDTGSEIADTIGLSGGVADFAITGNAIEKKDEKKRKKKEVVRYGREESPDFWKRKAAGTSDWFTLDTKGNWAWWVIGGYSVSVLLFRIADWLNGNIVPLTWFESSSGNIVNQMIAPEGNDLIALLIGAIAPCLSAPLWEEIFYRSGLGTVWQTVLTLTASRR
jgi:hypothetical protein